MRIDLNIFPAVAMTAASGHPYRLTALGKLIETADFHSAHAPLTADS